MPCKLLTAEEARRLARDWSRAPLHSDDEYLAARSMMRALLGHADALDAQDAEPESETPEADVETLKREILVAARDIRGALDAVVAIYNKVGAYANRATTEAPNG